MASTGGRQNVKHNLTKIIPEKYVPLPVGGFPLPASVKRKFSFPSQLPNISTLSLLPDFNSIQYDHLEDGLSPRRTVQPTPDIQPLRVRYSLIRPVESNSAGQSRSSTPTLRRKPKLISQPSLSFSILKSERFKEPETYTDSSDSVIDDATTVHGTSNTSRTPESSLSPANRPASEALDFMTTDSQSEHGTAADRISSKGKLYLSVRDQLAWKIKQCVPQLLRLFYIINLQLPGKPITVTSKRLLPNYSLCRDEAHFLDAEYPDVPWQIQVADNGGRKTYCVVLQGDLHSYLGNHNRPTHRFLSYVDLTEFVESVQFGENDIWDWEPWSPDVWLQVAHEEMRKDGIRVEDPHLRWYAKKVSKKDRLDIAMNIIEAAYQDFFILGSSDTAPEDFEITHVSQSLLELDRQDESLPDLSTLAGDLARGHCFQSELTWVIPRTVYCVPMYGPQLNSWLCFLVDGSLPTMWY